MTWWARKSNGAERKASAGRAPLRADKGSIVMSSRLALRLLSPRDRRLLWIAILLQMATSILDLVGVLLLGATAALAVTVVQSQPPPLVVSNLSGLFALQELSSQQLVLVLGIVAAVALLIKSAVSSILLRRVLRFLANRQALISARLISELMRRPLTEIQQRSSQNTAYALMGGTAAATIGLLGSLVVLATEGALLVLLGTALLFVDPLVTVGAIAFFGLVAGAIQRPLGTWGGRIGLTGARVEVLSLNAIQEALAAYREITVSDRRGLYVSRVQDLRWQSASVAADAAFIGQVPKYVLEAAMVIGGFLLAGFLFLTKDAVAAVGILAVYLAATSRVMPSMLRLQGAALSLRSSAGAATPTFELAEWLGHPVDTENDGTALDAIRRFTHADHSGFRPEIRVEDVTFRYPGAADPAIHGVSFAVKAGGSVALVGSSGAGKSTLADLILGILSPESGRILISGLSPESAVSRFPGAIAYVPQDIVLANGTVRANVGLGLPEGAIDDALVWSCLRQAHLDQFLGDQRQGLDTQVGEGGVRLSGGQRQRLGLARALYTQPRLIVLDEATSALDAETEQTISDTMKDLARTVTVVIIAHRLSTVRSVDQLLFLEGGRITAEGTFEEVRRMVPAFARQSRLMGL